MAAALLTLPARAAREPQRIASRVYDLKGRTEPGTPVEVFLGGRPAGKAVAGGDGRFSVAGIKLEEGLNALRVVVTDAAGNRRELTKQVLVDTTPPDWEFISPAVGARQKERTVKLEGATEAGATVRLSLNGKARPTGNVPADGRYVQQVEGLELGENRLAVEVADALGNTTKAAVTVFVKPPPELGVKGDWEAPVPEPEVVLEGASEPGVRVTLTLNGKPVGEPLTVGDDGSYAFTLTDLLDGRYVAEIVAVDDVGNEVRKEIRFTVAVPKPPPPRPLRISSPKEGEVSRQHWVLVRGTAEPNTLVRLLQRDVAVGAVRSSARGEYAFPKLQLPNGKHELSVVATPRDDVDQRASVRLTVAVPPVVPALQVPGLRADGSIVGTRTDVLVRGRPGAKVDLRVNGSPAGSGVLKADGELTFLAIELQPGVNFLSATLRDDTGERSALQSKVVSGR